MNLEEMDGSRLEVLPNAGGTLEAIVVVVLIMVLLGAMAAAILTRGTRWAAPARTWVLVGIATVLFFVLVTASRGDPGILLLAVSWVLPLAFVTFVVYALVRVLRMLGEIRDSLARLEQRERERL